MASTMTAGIILVIVTFLEYSWTSEVIKIGVILPMGGSYPYSMQKTVPALQLAIHNINLPNYSMELVSRDSECSATTGPLEAIELYKQKNAHVFIGPACDYAVAPVARFSSKWGIPVLTAGALASAFSNKAEYKLLTRLMGSYSQVGDVFMSVLQHFNWTHVGLIYSRGKSDCLSTVEALHAAIKRNHGYSAWHVSFDANKPDLNVKNLFEQAKNESRILVLCAAPDHVRQFLIHAHENSDDDFVFISVNRGSEKTKPWFKAEDTPEKNEKARRSYEALLTISTREPASLEYRAFSKEVNERGRSMYPGYIYEEKVNSFVGAFHDALILYALALNETIQSGGNITDGAAITSRMWDRTFQGITGTVSIDDNGDRNMDYCLMDMNPDTGKFEVVAYYYGNRKTYVAVPNKSIHWAGGKTSPPTDVPKCGFDGAGCRTDVLMGCPAQCTQNSSHCTPVKGGPYVAEWSSLSQYAKEISLGLKNSLQSQLRAIKYRKEMKQWISLCPVNKKPKNKTERTGVAVEVFVELIAVLKEKERKLKESFLFYTCNESETTLSNLTAAACHLSSALPNSSDTSITLSNENLQHLNVTDSLRVFQTFSECIARKLKRVQKCAEPVSSKCLSRVVKSLRKCSDPVFAGCKRRRDKKRGGRKRKGERRKDKKKGRTGKEKGGKHMK